MDGIHVVQDGVARKVERFMRIEVRALALEHIGRIGPRSDRYTRYEIRNSCRAECMVVGFGHALTHRIHTIAPVSLLAVQYTGAQRICRVYFTLVVV